MYEDYYGLTEKPFSILPDPDFIFWSRGHSLAYAMLQYGVLNQAGFTVITGDIGAGKTTLVRHLLNKLGDDVTVGLVSQTPGDGSGLLKWILMSLGQSFDDQSYVGLYQQFQQFLIAEYAQNRRTVIIIDEAQNLGQDALEELRMLSNINADKAQLIQLIIVGQPQLKDILQRPELAQFVQRVSSDFHLRPLSEEEVRNYIQHRLERSGAKTALFSDAACEQIFRASRGIPRVVNILCDTSLVYGFASEADQISAQIVHTVLANKGEYGVFSMNGANDDGPRLKEVKSD